MELLPYMPADSGPRMRTVQIWNIMEDTSNGLAYIHGLNEIHRGLKPRNSMSKDYNC
jgi:serine/threonine protein kinase